MLQNDDGTLTAIEDDKLYHIVAGMYMGQMLGSAEETSMGILTITPRDEAGNPIAVSDLVNYVVKDENGNPVKEWYAIATYLDAMEGGEMDARYEKPDGRKNVYVSLNPVKLVRNANLFTYVVLAVILLLAAVITLVTVKIVRRVKRRKSAATAAAAAADTAP